MHRNNLKVRNFQESNVSFLVMLIVWVLVGITVTGTAADDDSTASDTPKPVAVDTLSDSGDITDSALSTGDDFPGEDEEYIFSEEYEATGDNDETVTAPPADTTPDVPVVPRKRPIGGKRGKRFLVIVSFIQQKIVKNIHLFDGPVALLKKHAAKLLLLGISLMIILLTITFYRERLEKGRFMTTTRLSVMDKEVQRACRYIEEHFDDPELGTERICSALVTGEAFLEALFVKELGLTVGDFISQVRINRAKIILRNEPSIAREALVAAVGFTDEHRFDERFSTITGLSLEAYRTHLSESADVPS